MFIRPSSIESAGAHRRPSLSRRRRCTSSRSTRTAMPSPISPIRCASRLPKAGHRPRRCAASRARKPPGRAKAGEVIFEGVPVSTGREARVTQAGDYRFFAGWRSDPFFFDVQGRPEQLSVHRRAISLPTRTFAASCWKCPTRLWGRERLAYGPARWSRQTARAGAGCRRIAARGPSQTPFLAGEQNDAYLAARAGGRCTFRPRLRARAGARGWLYAGGSKAGGRDDCCRTSCATTPRARRPSRTMAGHSPTTSPMRSWLSSQMGR